MFRLGESSRLLALLTAGALVGGALLMEPSALGQRRRRPRPPAGAVVPADAGQAGGDAGAGAEPTPTAAPTATPTAGAAGPVVPDDRAPFDFAQVTVPEIEALKAAALAPTRTPLGDIRWLLEEINADLPDPTPVSKGGPRLRFRPKKKAVAAPAPTPPPPGSPAPAEPDWIAQLRALTLAGDLTPARDEAIARVELIRKIGQHPGSAAVKALLEVAFAHDGIFRDECGRTIRSLGGAALPELIRAGQKHGNWKVRRYANYQLDRMDRAVPAKALAQRDDLLRSEILHAYGTTRHEVAVRAVLGQTNAESPRVREMARWAFKRYLTGPRPKVRKRKLKLPGGKQSKKEHIWLSYRDIATIAVKETLREEKGEPPLPTPKAGSTRPPAGDPRPPLESMQELFQLYDARRLARWDETFARAEKLLKAGDAAGAAAAFDEILSHDPQHPKRHQMAAAFAALADKARAPEAERLWRKARLLDPKGETGTRARQALARLDGAERPGVHLAPRGPGAPTDALTAPSGGMETAGMYGAGALALALLLLSGVGLLRSSRRD